MFKSEEVVQKLKIFSECRLNTPISNERSKQWSFMKETKKAEFDAVGNTLGQIPSDLLVNNFIIHPETILNSDWLRGSKYQLIFAETWYLLVIFAETWDLLVIFAELIFATDICCQRQELSLFHLYSKK